MSYEFRICPTDRLIIEWRPEQGGARFGFYRVCDSPNDAKRSLSVINGDAPQDEPQLELFEEVTP